MDFDLIRELVDIHSPSGYTDDVIAHIEQRLRDKGYIIKRTNKGALLVSNTDDPQYAVCAHIDTLGGMVKEINSDGTLGLTQIGGWPVNSFEGEYVTVRTSSSKQFRGTFLLKNPAAHVNREVGSTKRDMSNTHVRLDSASSSEKETKALGISVGDFVFFDPRYEHTDTGFIKSRFMDDKACSGVLFDILLNYSDIFSKASVCFYFSNYEEVGHGAAAGLPQTVKELLVADMGVVGTGTQGDEHFVSICAKDSSGPYDYNLRRTLETICSEKKIPYKTDVFPYYGSDGSAALRAGYNIRVGLIGPGVSASHGVERVHEKGVQATEDLIVEYLKTLV